MGKDTLKLTRKIQLLVDLPTKAERKEALDKLYQWRNRSFKAANLIISHLYVQEMIQEFFYLTEGIKYKLADEKKDEAGILNRSRINATYRVVSDRYKGEIPTNILGNINHNLMGTFQKHKVEYWKGERSLMNFRRAIGEAKRATKLDSTYAPAYRLLGDIYVRFIEDDKKALEYYQKYLELEPDNAEGLYFFGLACIRAGAYDRINRHILPYMERNDQDHRLIPLIAIGAFFDEQYGAALEQFERYLSKVEAEERDRYTDIKLIASNIELKAFQEITEASERQIYLDKFWGRRDPDILTPINERIIEHYRRVWYASTFLSENVTPWDRRGEVYIRFGEPDQRSTSDERQLIVSPEVEAVRMRMAVDMYGPQAAYLTFTGPVFPIRKHNLNTGERIGESFDLDADADLDDIIVGEDQAAQAVEGVAERA